MSRRAFWRKHLSLKQMLPCESVEERQHKRNRAVLGNSREDKHGTFLFFLDSQMCMEVVSSVNRKKYYQAGVRRHSW